MCDCDNPDCSLPAGRCYLCGTPTDKVHDDDDDAVEFTVGPCCAKRVQELYEAETKIGDEVPWAPFNGTFDPDDNLLLAQIQMDDTADVFNGDKGAAHYVAWRLGIEPTYPEGF